jgi:hypothetical protein
MEKNIDGSLEVVRVREEQMTTPLVMALVKLIGFL